VRKVDLRTAWSPPGRGQQDVNKPKVLRNVGPSIGYKLRDAAGQAREFHNYMLPVDTGDGVPVFLLGMREKPEPTHSAICACRPTRTARWMASALRAALGDAADARPRGARYARAPPIRRGPSWREQLRASATRALALFAGAERVKAKATSGLLAVSPSSWSSTCPRPSARAPARCWCASSTGAVRAAQPEPRIGRPGGRCRATTRPRPS
jgi:cytochrome c biogenesis protein